MSRPGARCRTRDDRTGTASGPACSHAAGHHATRQPCALGRLGAIAAVVLLAAPKGAGAFPLLGSGEIHFRLDHASFRSGAGTTESEFYLEVDNGELEFQERDDRYVAEVEFRIDFYGGGKRIGRREYPLDLVEQAPRLPGGGIPPEVLARRQVLELRIPVPESTDSVQVEVEDKNARKHGLVYMFTKARKGGSAGSGLVPRQFPPEELSVSDLEFARPFGSGLIDSTFLKSGIDVEPNPGRVYGAAERVVSTYFEVYDLAPWEPGERRQYDLGYVLRDQEGIEIRSWGRKLSSQVQTWADTMSFEVSTLPAGTYFLGVTVKEGSRGGRAVVDASFDVVWAAANWTRWLMETEAVVPFLLGGLELDSFIALGPGAKERYLQRFWAAHDPTPGQGNATREEFERRVAFANTNYSTTIEPGMRTDRGRVYIKYGEPDEVRRELIPVQGNDINAALDELDRSTAGDLVGHRAIDPEDTRAFEVWIYDYRGYELFPTDHMSTSLGRQFVFVDDLGVGDYRLIRSSEKGEF